MDTMRWRFYLRRLTLNEALDLAKQHMENARSATDIRKKLRLFQKAEATIKHAEKIIEKQKKSDDMLIGIAIARAYHQHSVLLIDLEPSKAQGSHSQAEKWGYIHVGNGKVTGTMIHPSLCPPVVSKKIFTQNITPPVAKHQFPDIDRRLKDTTQLVYCLNLLATEQLNDGQLDQDERRWLKYTNDEPQEREWLQATATDLIRAFIRDEVKSSAAVKEIVCLAPVLGKEDFRKLLQEFVDVIHRSTLQNDVLLNGLAQLIRNSSLDNFDVDDLLRILVLLSDSLQRTHLQSRYNHQLAYTTSRVLDSIMDSQLGSLDRDRIHAPLLDHLKRLRNDSDPYLVFQVAYAIQALVYIGDGETKVMKFLRRSGKIIKGISGIVAAVKAIDLDSFIESLENIQEGLSGATVVYHAVVLANSGKNFYECVKEAFNFDNRSVWYPALRGLDSLIQDGRFADFEKLVRNAPCQMDPAYQWGVCQRLGEIANNPLWDINIRKYAIEFLVMYEDDTTWRMQVNVKQWILYILSQLKRSDTAIAGHVKDIMDGLAKNGDSGKQELYQACLNSQSRSYPLVATFQPNEFPLLKLVQDTPDIEAAIRQLKRERSPGKDDNVYISPIAKASLEETEYFDLMLKVHEFLESERKVFLLRGSSGSGKSTFSRALEIDLWDAYKVGGPIPLFIHLPDFDKPEQDLIEKRLSKANFTDNLIRELKLNRQLILICDAYDEIQTLQNLYTRNRLNEQGEWCAKMVIACRTEYIGKDYKDFFQPSDRNHAEDSSLFQEAVIAPFTEKQIHEYIDKYFSKGEPKKFTRAFKEIPVLKDLVKNPFVLKLSVEVLPQIMKSSTNLSSERITRVKIIDEFVALWLKRNKKRLTNMTLTPPYDKKLQRLVRDGFEEHAVCYTKELAVAIYLYQNGHPSISFSGANDRGTWKEWFFSNLDGKDLLRDSIPLTVSGNQYQFIHKLYLEHGLSLAVFDPNVDLPLETKSQSHTIPHMDATLSANLDRLPSVEKKVNLAQKKLLDSPLGTMHLAGNPSTTDCFEFLVERAHEHPLFRDNLLDVIEHSKAITKDSEADKKVCIAAANAITILVKAGFNFNGADLQNIRIQGADLSYGMFDSAQLDGADLRDVNFQNIWLRGSSLNNARMKDARFGEYPYIREASEVQSCVFSPDGSIFAVILTDGNIEIYDVNSWGKIQTLDRHEMEVLSAVFSPDGTYITFGTFGDESIVWLYEVATGAKVYAFKGHDDRISSVAFSPNGNHIASGSYDNTIRLWNVNTKESIKLKGHEECITTIAYSPNGNQIASSSDDYTVRLWDVFSGDCLHVLKDDTDFSVTNVVYSPNGEQIASVNYDRTVQLWDVESGELIHTLEGHTETLTGVAYSPDGTRIASASEDKTVRLWDVETGKCLRTLRGHTDHVINVVYSPRGDQFATGSIDKTVRLWHSDTGDCLQILHGNSDDITSLKYSPGGDRIASGNNGKSIRVWNVDTGLSIHATDTAWNVDTGMSVRSTDSHNGEVRAIALSSKGDQIASGGDDHTVRIWNVETGHCVLTLTGHTEPVISVKYSPNGDLIASAGREDTVRLWDPKTGNSVSELKHWNSVTCIAFSPNGKYIASGSSNRTVYLWDVKTGKCEHTLIHGDHAIRVLEVMYSPDGHHIASSSDDTTMRLWNVKTGICEHILEGHLGIVLSFAYSPSDNTIASGSQDKTVRLWDIKTGECTATFKGHKDNVTSVVYSPKGNIIASASKDNTVMLWDVKTHQCIHVLKGHEDSISSVIFSPNGKQIVTGSDDGAFRVWDVETGNCKATATSWNGKVQCLTLKEEKDDLILVAGGEDGSVRLWHITKDGAENKAILKWSSSHEVLNVSDVSFIGAQDITLLDRTLLEQRGALL